MHMELGHTWVSLKVSSAVDMYTCLLWFGFCRYFSSLNNCAVWACRCQEMSLRLSKSTLGLWCLHNFHERRAWVMKMCFVLYWVFCLGLCHLKERITQLKTVIEWLFIFHWHLALAPIRVFKNNSTSAPKKYAEYDFKSLFCNSCTRFTLMLITLKIINLENYGCHPSVATNDASVIISCISNNDDDEVKLHWFIIMSFCRLTVYANWRVLFKLLLLSYTPSLSSRFIISRSGTCVYFVVVAEIKITQFRKHFQTNVGMVESVIILIMHDNQ